MSITEERQQAQKPAPSSRRPRRNAPSSGHASNRSAASPTRCADPPPQPSDRPFEATNHDRLVYAVYRAKSAEPTPPPQRPSCNFRMDHGFVVEDVSDEMLLKNVAKGDKAAMHIIFARHRETVSRFIRRLVRNPAIVDDLVNQVFLDVWRSANRFESRARVSTWLLSIARFKAISSWRERTHEEIAQDDALGIVDVGETQDCRSRSQGNAGHPARVHRQIVPGSSGSHRAVLLL
ncbi:hypothetical protein ACVWYH_000860 [Bradyrhizobium sp. GM24.11]